MLERYTWEEMVEKYPEKWVILDNVEEIGATIISAEIIEICTDEDIDKIYVEYIKAGKKYQKRRTTDMIGEMGIINAKNFEFYVR